jgi:aerobic carbon-monoxide dehydrogenase medium subunit
VKPAPFDYHAPSAVPEALEILDLHRDDAKALAGGQSLVPMLALRLTRFEHLVDLQHIAELSTIAAGDDAVVIGAMTTQAAIGRHHQVAELVPLLHRATPLIGHQQIRNRGTLGGSVCHADPASEYPAVLVALDAELSISSATGERTAGAADFFEGTWSTTLDSGELLTHVRFPRWGARSGFAIDEVARRHGDFALVGAAAAVQLDPGDHVTRAGLALFGVASTPFDARPLAGLDGRALTDLDDAALREIGEAVARALDPPADVHASSAYRRKVAGRLIPKVLRQAIEEAARG